MYGYGPSYTQCKEAGRESRPFWSWSDDDYTVVKVTGFATQYPDAWWVPELGFTMTIGRHLFDTRTEALIAVNNKLLDQREQLERKLAHVREQQ